MSNADRTSARTSVELLLDGLSRLQEAQTRQVLHHLIVGFHSSTRQSEPSLLAVVLLLRFQPTPHQC